MLLCTALRLSASLGCLFSFSAASGDLLPCSAVAIVCVFPDFLVSGGFRCRAPSSFDADAPLLDSENNIVLCSWIRCSVLGVSSGPSIGVLLSAEFRVFVESFGWFFAGVINSCAISPEFLLFLGNRAQFRTFALGAFVPRLQSRACASCHLPCGRYDGNVGFLSIARVFFVLKVGILTPKDCCARLC